MLIKYKYKTYDRAATVELLRFINRAPANWGDYAGGFPRGAGAKWFHAFSTDGTCDPLTNAFLLLQDAGCIDDIRELEWLTDLAKLCLIRRPDGTVKVAYYNLRGLLFLAWFAGAIGRHGLEKARQMPTYS